MPSVGSRVVHLPSGLVGYVTAVDRADRLLCVMYEVDPPTWEPGWWFVEDFQLLEDN